MCDNFLLPHTRALPLSLYLSLLVVGRDIALNCSAVSSSPPRLHNTLEAGALEKKKGKAYTSIIATPLHSASLHLYNTRVPTPRAGGKQAYPQVVQMKPRPRSRIFGFYGYTNMYARSRCKTCYENIVIKLSSYVYIPDGSLNVPPRWIDVLFLFFFILCWFGSGGSGAPWQAAHISSTQYQPSSIVFDTKLMTLTICKNQKNVQ